ncbi:MAG: Fis family transcriptional regulator [Myxococcales bacterium]|nr:Fis family transcriptional regulator [Myxococcales bacterium]
MMAVNSPISHPLQSLERILERISLEDLVYHRLKPVFDRLDLAQVDSFYKFVIGQVERPLIRLALEKSNGNQSQAAKILGINRNTLRKKITQLGLDSDAGDG